MNRYFPISIFAAILCCIIFYSNTLYANPVPQEKTQPKKKRPKKTVPGLVPSDKMPAKFKVPLPAPGDKIKRKRKPDSFEQQPSGPTTFANDPIGVKQYVLKNGLTVLLSENHDVPQVYGAIAVKAGGKNDPADATGMAHYLEHMLFKGTKEMGTINFEAEKPHLDSINNLYELLQQSSDEERTNIQHLINEQSVKAGEYAIANELDKLLAQIGATGVNAFTTEDFTTYHNRFPSNQMERWLEIYSHRFEEPVFRLFQSELETVYEEKNRSMDSPFNRLFETFNEHFYKNHPYGQQTIIGKTEHLKNPPLKKMYEYFDQYYVANNMALVMSGDFKTEEILPMIEEKFGDWRSGPVPEFPEYKEEPFNGRELIEVKFTPVKVGAIGFRSPENGHPDEAAMMVANRMLSNYEKTGIIDQLVIESKVLEAGVEMMPYNDYGLTLIYFIPKVLGQKLEDAEKLIMDQLDRAKNGELDEEMLQAVKLSIKTEIARKWESNWERTLEMIFAYSQNRSWGDYMQLEKDLEALTKEDIIAALNKYFPDNYLCLYSKMGFPKAEKLDKPSFEAVIPKNEVKSAFRQQWEDIPSTSPQARFVDFEKDISSASINERINIYSNHNKFNDIFTLRITFGLGKYQQPLLQYNDQYLSLIGTDEFSASEIKKEFFKLGCSYWFESEEESFSMVIEGVESNLSQAIELAGKFAQNAKPDQEKVKKLLDELETEKKISRREPSFIAGALQQYVLFGKNSRYLRELDKKQLKSLTGEELVNSFKEAQDYEVTIHFTGKKKASEVKTLFSDHFTFHENLKPKSPKVVLPRQELKENAVYLVNKKKAVQSQLYFNVPGKPLEVEEMPKIDAFNSYFGGDMSSLVFQEIREYRSLAYSAYGNYKPAELPGKESHFFCYIGCQDDKTLDATKAMMTLIKDMPQKTEREDMIKKALMERAQSNRPSFRNLLTKIEDWKSLGYQDDPNKMKMQYYKDITFNDIISFYEKEIKGKPVVITVVGNKKRFDTKALAKYGKVVEVKEKDLFVN